MAWSSESNAEIFCQRSDGFRARHRETSKSRIGGTSCCSFEIDTGFSFKLRTAASTELRAGNADWPVIISYITTPNAKMSVRESVSRPCSCSGDMYPRVPAALFDGDAGVPG